MTTHAMGTYISFMRNQSLDMFKTFRAEVETQLRKKIKCIRSDHGGEYYGRFDVC